MRVLPEAFSSYAPLALEYMQWVAQRMLAVIFGSCHCKTPCIGWWTTSTTGFVFSGMRNCEIKLHKSHWAGDPLSLDATCSHTLGLFQANRRTAPLRRQQTLVVRHNEVLPFLVFLAACDGSVEALFKVVLLNLDSEAFWDQGLSRFTFTQIVQAPRFFNQCTLVSLVLHLALDPAP